MGPYGGGGPFCELPNVESGSTSSCSCINTPSHSWFGRPFAATKRLSCLQISSLRWGEKVWPCLSSARIGGEEIFSKLTLIPQMSLAPSRDERHFVPLEKTQSAQWLTRRYFMYMIFSNKANNAKLMPLFYFFCFLGAKWNNSMKRKPRTEKNEPDSERKQVKIMEPLSKVYLASVRRLDAHWEEKEITLKLKWGF